MPASNSLGELLSTIFERRPFSRVEQDNRSAADLCRALLSQKTELTGVQIAALLLDRYKGFDAEQKLEFFRLLNDEFDIDRAAIAGLAKAYADDPSSENYARFSAGAEPRRQELFRRLNEVPGATAELVGMRADLLGFLKSEPLLARVDQDFLHLLRSWFNRGFLVLRQITWGSPASILEKVIAYEAVHEIRTWDDLRQRLQPVDRRCFAFFHPAMPDDPLIFVEIALVSGVPASIQELLSGDRKVLRDDEADTAVFYSISNCQKGLAGVSFGNSLIKQVARDLARDLPNVKSFVTLSPIPGLVRWLTREDRLAQADDPTMLRRLAAQYLVQEKTGDGRPLDPVARFHLANGAQIHAIHADADISENGLAQSRGVMVNYLYDLGRISRNLQQFAESGAVAASSAVRTLARQASKG
ncbi:malonyl-CoA decarboxylase [Frigidibacter sp. ROC022]|uniref:malonyl-CoA decarboxylase n=1 Tax=Frigidibacter sp. ROC022 TaxID=2971796 RepID=UPI00215AB321|nr:malonyl-CoA decarboxylase [Frigidibacter sp. ROC022]MCR8725170.1 malonyl-CoA decarboxylase [Frigidibacter sp. ROC022]